MSDNSLNYRVSKRVQALRRQRGWSQVAMARKLGYNADSVISKIESGQHRISLELLERYAAAFGMEPDRLLRPMTLQAVVTREVTL